MLREKGKGLIGRGLGGTNKIVWTLYLIHSEKELYMYSTGNTKIILADHDRFPSLQQTVTIACTGTSHFTGNT